ncbi:hypothetical protein ACJIZ3_001448 [Penstemon smallii]|uniref:Gag1-like clamp domain-containing protein n=1 Tax=Penstemon smallii TaxID=265156 RepID=A0ABD3U6H8_9LAMI
MYNRCCIISQMEACIERRPFRSFLEGCLGSCTNVPLVISVDEPSKGLKIKGQRVNKRSSTKEEFWSSSSGDMDNSAFQSHRSISSISTSNQTLDNHSSASGSSNPAEFVNHGLLLWNQTRQQWIGNKGSEKPVQAQDPKLSWNATYESLLGTNKPFPQPIPLAEMVDFLVDVWEQEGLYD